VTSWSLSRPSILALATLICGLWRVLITSRRLVDPRLLGDLAELIPLTPPMSPMAGMLYLATVYQAVVYLLNFIHRLPDADKGAPCTNVAHIRSIFGRMGFNDREMVALIGAHAIGRCHTDASGYWGPWTRAETTFSNEFYR
jgi:hypothetical protein